MNTDAFCCSLSGESEEDRDGGSDSKVQTYAIMLGPKFSPYCFGSSALTSPPQQKLVPNMNAESRGV